MSSWWKHLSVRSVVYLRNKFYRLRGLFVHFLEDLPLSKVLASYVNFTYDNYLQRGDDYLDNFKSLLLDSDLSVRLRAKQKTLQPECTHRGI